MDASLWINKLLESYQCMEVDTIVTLLDGSKISSSGDLNSTIYNAVWEVIADSADQDSLTEFAFNYATFLIHKQEKKPILTAFSHLNTSIKAYCRFYQSNVLSGKWSVKVVDYLCKTLKDLSYLAEKTYVKCKDESKELEEPPIKMAKVTLESVFNKSQIIKEGFPDSRKLAAFFAVIHIFEMFFRDNKFRMWLRYVDWVEKMPEGFELLPEHTKVSFKYYEGLLQLFQYKYLESFSNLNYWISKYKGSDETFIDNVQKFLIPLKLLFGDYPETSLLENHKLIQYADICTAWKEGNLALFEESLYKNEAKFLSANIYLMLEKLKNIVYRNIFMRAYLANNSENRIKLDILLDEFNKEVAKVRAVIPDEDNPDLNMLELESILSGLIYKGFIKGYILHEEETLITAKQDAFPELKDVIKTNGSKI